mmetsp:Transcript_84663/g.218216  ORF Transcript_84663/g.218216 Transcript_84663/m.218216 type:complete len:136 (+) Transcript_84663:830-1237(+)
MDVARFGAGAAWHEGRILVAGGSTHFGRKQLTTLEALDPREGTWRLEKAFRTPAGPGYQTSLWGCSVAVHAHWLYLCGGTFREAEESQDTLFRIDLRTMELDTCNFLAADSPEQGPVKLALQVPRWCGGACVIGL